MRAEKFLIRKTTIPYNTPEHRSWTMSRIRAKNTKPEILVRQLTYSLGYRYRLHPNDVPGKPDLAFKSRKKAIFVHGCFWHQHDDPACKISHAPKSNTDYWAPKLQKNLDRDKRVTAELDRIGWKSMTVWECQLQNLEDIQNQIDAFLRPET
ncbi:MULTISPECIES: very short patch repair endonuclease [Rhizobium]|nr:MULTISPECIES: very short patch repair endonuclease [Rhizobium]